MIKIIQNLIQNQSKHKIILLMGCIQKTERNVETFLPFHHLKAGGSGGGLHPHRSH